MEYVINIINESGLSKVKIAKYLGVSRQMLYNYLSLESFDELAKDKQKKFLNLFGVEKIEDLKDVKVNEKFITEIENKINTEMLDSIGKDSIADLKGLNKKEQEILSDIFSTLKDKLVEKQDNAYDTLRYINFYLNRMEQIPELKYILAYIAKSNCFIPADEYIFDEDKQYIFEGIFYTAMSLYQNRNNGNLSMNKISESHKKFEKEIEDKKEEALGRTQELNSYKAQALNELGYTKLVESNAKEVFEKIAEIMSSKF